jgi:hypothetical protein
VNRRRDSRHITTEAFLTRSVASALVKYLGMLCFAQRRDMRPVSARVVQGSFSFEGSIFGRLCRFRSMLPSAQKAFQKEPLGAVLSDLTTTAEPIHPRFRSPAVVRGEQDSIARTHQFSLPRDEILPRLPQCSQASLPPPGPDSNFRLPFVFVHRVQYGKARDNAALVGSRS